MLFCDGAVVIHAGAKVSTLKQELALQHKRLTEEAAAERRMLQQQFESKLESQQVIELAQAAAAQQALRGAELVQSQLSERAACLAAEVRVARFLPRPYVLPLPCRCLLLMLKEDNDAK